MAKKKGNPYHIKSGEHGGRFTSKEEEHAAKVTKAARKGVFKPKTTGWGMEDMELEDIKSELRDVIEVWGEDPEDFDFNELGSYLMDLLAQLRDVHEYTLVGDLDDVIDVFDSRFMDAFGEPGIMDDIIKWSKQMLAKL